MQRPRQWDDPARTCRDEMNNPDSRHETGAYHPPASATAASWASLTFASSNPFNDISAFPLSRPPRPGSAIIGWGRDASKYFDGRMSESAGSKFQGKPRPNHQCRISLPVCLQQSGAGRKGHGGRRRFLGARRAISGNRSTPPGQDGHGEVGRKQRDRATRDFGRFNPFEWMASRSGGVRAPLILKR